MITNDLSKVYEIISNQRDFFQTGKTKDINFRIEQLKILKQAILDHEKAIIQALAADLHKPEFETHLTEIRVLSEIDYAIKNLKKWTQPQKAAVPWKFFSYSAKIYPEPLGVVLIISPWNYPLGLIISPLVGAMAAGNCTIIKPSEIAPHTSTLVAEIISKYFPPEYIAVLEGGVETSQQLLAEKFDHIFFTGGTAIGKIVMAAAAKHLTPVTLELGGKSPCIIDSQINLDYTVKRIVWGKFLNAGQSCIVPDYLLIDHKIKKDLIESIKKCLTEFYGDNPATSPDYPRIVNRKQFDRLTHLLKDSEIIIGGETNPEELYIAPTVIDHVSVNHPVMQEEIFGPILPILEYKDITEAIALINSQPKPLALYLFTENQKLQKQILQQTSSGGVCINDTILQFGLLSLPFGGVGDSGIGSYHGKDSFDTFSHYKSVLKNSFILDINWRYPPYKGKLPLLKLLLR